MPSQISSLQRRWEVSSTQRQGLYFQCASPATRGDTLRLHLGSTPGLQWAFSSMIATSLGSITHPRSRGRAICSARSVNQSGNRSRFAFYLRWPFSASQLAPRKPSIFLHGATDSDSSSLEVVVLALSVTSLLVMVSADHLSLSLKEQVAWIQVVSTYPGSVPPFFSKLLLLHLNTHSSLFTLISTCLSIPPDNLPARAMTT